MMQEGSLKRKNPIGHEQERRPGIRIHQLFSMGFGAIIGVGWITLLGGWISSGGTIGAVVAFAIGGALMVIIGVCYGELGSAFPIYGAEIVYARAAYGKNLSFFTGWMLLLFYLSTIAFEAISAGWVLTTIFPLINGPTLFELRDSAVTVGQLGIAVLGSLAIAALNLRGGTASVRFQEVLTWTLCLFCVGFLVLAIVYGDFGHAEPWFSTSPAGSIVPGIISVLVVTPFLYAGFNALPQGVADVAKGENLNRVGMVITIAILAGSAFYCCIIFAASLTAPRDVLLSSSFPTSIAFEHLFGSTIIGKVVLFVGLVGIVSTWNPLFYSAVRLVMAMRTATSIPAADRRGELGPAVVLVLSVTVVASAFGKAALLPIVSTGAFCLVVIYLIVSICFLRLRKFAPQIARPFKAPFGNGTGWLACSISIALIAISLWEHWIRKLSVVPTEWLLLGAWMLFGCGVWINQWKGVSENRIVGD